MSTTMDNMVAPIVRLMHFQARNGKWIDHLATDGKAQIVTFLEV